MCKTVMCNTVMCKTVMCKTLNMLFLFRGIKRKIREQRELGEKVNKFDLQLSK